MKEDKNFENVMQEREFGQQIDNKQKGINPNTAENLMIGSLFALIVTHFVVMVVRYYQACVNVEKYVVSGNGFYFVASLVLPFCWWMYSTKQDAWHFHLRKLFTLWICLLNAALTVGQFTWTVVWVWVVPLILRLHPSRNVTAQMILDLARIALVVASVAVAWLVINFASNILFNDINKPQVLAFRIQHHVDLRKNKEHQYDLGIIRLLISGKTIWQKAGDRTVHTLVNGASGTGKTATVLDRMFVSDLDIKCQNMQLRTKKMLRMIKEGKLYVEPEKGKEIGEYNVKAYPKYQKEYKQVRERYPDMGFTFMAPNNSENNKIIRMCKARGCYVNVIDPMVRYDDKNVKNILLNPFYMPLGIDLLKQAEVIAGTASMFAEVLQAVNEKDGSGEEYFRGINTSATSNIAIVCMLYASIMERQTDFPEVQACINDFQLLEPKVQKIQEVFGIQVNVAQTKQRGKQDAERRDVASQGTILNAGKRLIPKTSIDQVPEKYKKLGLEEYNKILEEVNGIYYEPLHYIMTELLGPGAEKMFDQARGLRNLVNRLMLDPRIKRVLSGRDKGIINFDQILLNNEITVINTALEIGSAPSTALGLFIQLSLKTAILRRPEGARSLHVVSIDEASQYMHPMYEDMFALYRQYGVACVIAIQSLSQMDKTNVTKYLKGVIKGAGTHIVFGRAGDEEMKVYSDQGGLKDVNIVQEAITQTALIEADPSSSESKRKQHDRKNVVEGADIRVRDFQEVTVFTTDNGRVMNAQIGKTSFSEPSDFYDKHIKWVDWSKFVDQDAIPKPDKEKKHEETEKKTQEETLKKTDIRIDSVFDEKVPTKYTKEIPDIAAVNETLDDKDKRLSAQEIKAEGEVKKDINIDLSFNFNDLFGDKPGEDEQPDEIDDEKSALDRLNNESNIAIK